MSPSKTFQLYRINNIQCPPSPLPFDIGKNGGKQFITEIPPIKKKWELKKKKKSKKKYYEVKETGASTNFNDVETRSFANKSFQNNDELHLEDECGILIHFLGEFYTFTEAGFFAAMLLCFFIIVIFFYAPEHNLFFEAFYNSYRWDILFFYYYYSTCAQDIFKWQCKDAGLNLRDLILFNSVVFIFISLPFLFGFFIMCKILFGDENRAKHR